MFPQRGSSGERFSVSRANGLFIHSYMSPVKEPSHEVGRKHTVTVHGDPPGRKACVTMGCSLTLQGDRLDTAITTPLPCSLQHDIFHLVLGRPEPR